MIDGYPRILVIIAAVGAGVSGGVFFAFSVFVMKALGRLSAAQGISAMHAINSGLFRCSCSRYSGPERSASPVRRGARSPRPALGRLPTGTALYLACLI